MFENILKMPKCGNFVMILVSLRMHRKCLFWKYLLKKCHCVKNVFWVGRLLIISCSQIKTIYTSHFQNTFQNKHFVYILNGMRIITKLPYIGIFKKSFQKLIFKKYFQITNTLYTLSTIRESLQNCLTLEFSKYLSIQSFSNKYF